MSGRPSDGDDLASREEQVLLDKAACALLRTNADGLLLRVNRMFCDWIGRTPDELVGQRRIQDLLTMGGRIFHQTHWAPLMQMQGSVSEVKLEFLHSDGSTVPMVLNACRQVIDGVVTHEVAAFAARDRDKYERELVLARKRVEEAAVEAKRLQELASDRALFAEQMIGIVSHDLRNPLSSISLSAALLAHSDLLDDQQRNVKRVVRATEQAAELINTLLDFTQARIGKGLAVDFQSIDVHQVIAQAVDELSHIYSGRQLLHVHQSAGECIGDARRLTQLVGNLVSNAIAYGRLDAPITITSVIESASFSISVQNQGRPIPEDAQASIFQPMTRGTSPTRVASSIGLGLFVVHEIAKAHGGKASMSSTAAAGTTFSVSIPRGRP